LNNATIKTKGLINGASTPTVSTLLKKGIGGLLVIASPYNWLEHFAPRKQWLNGRTHAGALRTSLEVIGNKFSKPFIFVGEPQEMSLCFAGQRARFITIFRR
jgi:hypothetical protein